MCCRMVGRLAEADDVVGWVGVALVHEATIRGGGRRPKRGVSLARSQATLHNRGGLGLLVGPLMWRADTALVSLVALATALLAASQRSSADQQDPLCVGVPS